MTSVPTWVIGMALAAVIAILAFRARLLSGPGSLAAGITGVVAMGAGWSWGILLVVYFISASALTRFRAADKTERMAGRVEKEGARDAAQVLANGGVYTTMALGYWIRPDYDWMLLGAGALAASAADTWATELGSLSSAPPRALLGGDRVPVGTSGGVTALGIAGATAGSLFLACIAALIRWPDAAAVAAFAGGLVGCHVDSLLGASVQARYWCVSCATGTERRRHRCGTATIWVGGWRLLNNDGVNVAATVFGAVSGWAIAGFF